MLTRRLDELDLLVIYVDGLIFADHVVLAAVGVDRRGNKHVLGLQHAATESTAAAEDLLRGMVERGVSTEKNRLFVLDGSKALRAAVRRVFGKVPVQRCRAHKLRNVVERLPKAERDQAKAAIRAAWRLGAQDGQARLEKLAQWYEGDWPEAAVSLREGMEECFTINRLGAPPSLHRCLATTNIVESPNAGVRRENAASDPLEGRGHGVSLGHGCIPRYREKLPQDHGLQGSVDARRHPQSGPRPQQQRLPSTMLFYAAALQTLNYDWDTLLTACFRWAHEYCRRSPASPRARALAQHTPLKSSISGSILHWIGGHRGEVAIARERVQCR